VCKIIVICVVRTTFNNFGGKKEREVCNGNFHISTGLIGEIVL
jgi:hypothetical protein